MQLKLIEWFVFVLQYLRLFEMKNRCLDMVTASAYLNGLLHACFLLFSSFAMEIVNECRLSLLVTWVCVTSIM